MMKNIHSPISWRARRLHNTDEVETRAEGTHVVQRRENVRDKCGERERVKYHRPHERKISII